MEEIKQYYFSEWNFLSYATPVLLLLNTMQYFTNKFNLFKELQYILLKAECLVSS